MDRPIGVTSSVSPNQMSEQSIAIACAAVSSLAILIAALFGYC
jgi:hypothetical protein